MGVRKNSCAPPPSLASDSHAIPVRDRDEVVRGLRDSFAELVSYARALPPQAWEAQTGLLYIGRPVTIASSVAVLAHDIDAHRKELGA